jgi:hypothetical protein
MILAHENKCAMCGKDAVVRDEPDRKNEKEQQQQENNSTSTIIVEQIINGTCYTFDTANCALMFKKFRAVYGSSFADE